MNSFAHTGALRTAVLEFLSERLSLAFDNSQILRGLQVNRLVDFRVEMGDVCDAVAFLESAGLISVKHHTMGATKYAQATSAGVLHSERERAQRELS
jgi:hypothetical protein